MMMQKAKQLRMVGYGRVSTDADKQLDSLQHQLQFFDEFANTRNFQLVGVYADEGISGKQLKKRDDFLRMMRDAERGLFDVVVVKDVSRFARNTVDLLTSVRKLKALGVNVMFVNNNQQALGESEFVLTLLGAMAQEESANLSKRVKFGKNVTAKRGRVPRVVLGYDKIDNFTLAINEDEAALVRRIFSMYVNGDGGMAHIATVLRGEGVKTKLGCNYTEGYIRRILTSPLYCGVLVNHKSETADFIEGTVRRLPEDQHYRHERPELAIISKELFDQAQKIRTRRCADQIGRGQDPRRRYTNRYLFSGVVRCAECGRTMFRNNVNRANGQVDGYWRCPSGTKMKNDDRCHNSVHLRDEVLQEAFMSALRECVGDPAKFANDVMAHKHSNIPSEEELKADQAEKERALKKVKTQKEKYMEMYSNDLIDMDELKPHLTQLNERAEQLTRELSLLRDAQERHTEDKPRIAERLQDIEDFLSLTTATNQDVRRILSHVEASANRTLHFVFNGV